MFRAVIVVLLLLPALGFAQADQLVPNGFARYTELSEELYIGGLYTEFPSQDPATLRGSANIRMEMKITTERLAARKLARLFVSSSAINNRPEVLTANAGAMESFLGSFKDHLYWGDHIVVDRTATGLTLSINNVELAAVESADLFNMLLNIWIGDVPPSREFKAQILGAETAEGLQAAFVNVSFPTDRVAVIESWASSEEAPAEAVAQAAPSPRPRPTPVVTAPVVPEPVAQAEPSPSPSPTPQVARAPQPAPEPEPEDDLEDEFSAENLLAAQLYANDLLRHSQRNMSYPNISRRLGHEGTVVASVTISRDGELLDYVLTEESEHSPLNSAVRKGIRRAEPFPEIPERIRGNSFTFRVPVTFKFSQ